ncbi:MAG: thiamine-phosphate kinase [Bacteroidota bacterium]
MNENAPQNFTPLSSLGEFGLIDRIKGNFTPRNAEVSKGIGDDAAIYAIGNGEVHAVSTDLLVEGVHFDLSYVPLAHLGYKSVVVNLSDIYAMNCVPFGITVSLALSNRFTVEAIDAFYQGVKKACEFYGVDLLGGDTSSSRSGLMISVTAMGRGRAEEVVYRNGAQVNDLVCVTGDIGAAYAGLQILEREKSVFLKNPEIQPDLGGFDYVVGRQLKPEARKDVIEELRTANVRPTAMIDLSDGLASDLRHLCRDSNTGATIYEEKIMVDHQVHTIAEEFQIAALTMALNGGEDYELLFTVPLDVFERISMVKDVYVIGHIEDVSAGVNIVTQSGGFFPLEAQGWNHFRESE